MRILHLIATLATSIGGPARSVTALADAQARRGHRVVVLSAATDEPMVTPKLARLETRRTSWRSRQGWSLGVLRRAVELSRRADVVHVHGLWLQPAWMGVAARRHHALLVVSPRGMLSEAALEQRSRQKAFSLALIERELLRSADVVIASSLGEQVDVLALDPSLRVIVVPNGIEQVAARPLPYCGETVLYLGRLDPFKRVELLVEAISLLPNHRLLIAGDGDSAYRRVLEQLIVERRVSDRVEFLGWVDDRQKAAALARTSVLALVSRSENFGVSALEALSVGRPVVVTPGLPWQAHEGMGVLVAGDDRPAAIAAALASSTTPSTYEHKSARALITASGYTWDAIAARFDEIVGAPLQNLHIDPTQATTV